MKNCRPHSRSRWDPADWRHSWPAGAVPALVEANHAGSRSVGVLLRYDPQLQIVLQAARFTTAVTDLALAGDGDVLVLSGGTIKVSPDLQTVRWIGPGGRRVDGDGAGGAFVLTDKRNVTRILPDGSTGGSFKVGTGFGVTDIAVDPISQQFFVCGSKSARGGGNPVHIAYMHAHNFEGSRTWKVYDFSGPEVNSVSDMADSHPQRLAVVDGSLYMTGDTEGGNTVYRHDPRTLGGSLGEGVLAGNWYNGNTWKAMSSRRIAFAGRYDVSDGELLAGTLLLRHDPRREAGP